jgi:hypothetical protein
MPDRHACGGSTCTCLLPIGVKPPDSTPQPQRAVRRGTGRNLTAPLVCDGGRYGRLPVGAVLSCYARSQSLSQRKERSTGPSPPCGFRSLTQCLRAAAPVAEGLFPSRAQAENFAQIVAFLRRDKKRQTIFLVFRLRLLPPRSPRGRGAAAAAPKNDKGTEERRIMRRHDNLEGRA